MEITKTDFDGVFICKPRVFNDERGYFMESYNNKAFAEVGLSFNFIQDNQAASTYGVVRGLHFQMGSAAQTKLIRVLQGSIIDAIVDLRKGSATFGKSMTIALSAENKLQLLVPKGFAHGYSVTSATAEVLYKCDHFYDKSSEAGLYLGDEALAIDWGIAPEDRIISEKDRVNPLLADLDPSSLFQE